MSATKPSANRTLAAVEWLLLLIGVAPLAAYAHTGRYVRYVADDFCMSSAARMRGILGATWDYYLHWTGRVNYLLTLHSLYAIGTWTATLVPALSLCANVVSFAWVLRLSLPFVGLAVNWRRGLILGCLLVFGSIQATPYPFQSFFWQNTMVNYCLPWTFIALGIGIVIKQRTVNRKSHRVGGIVACALLGFLCSSFTEGLMALLVLLSVGATALTLWTVRIRGSQGARTLLAPTFAAATGSLIGAAILVLAPGNQVRLAAMAHGPPSLARAIPDAFLGVFTSIGYVVSTHGAIVLACGAVAAFLGAISCSREGLEPPQPFATIAFGVILVALALMFATLLPGYYASDGPPPERAWVEPILLIVLSCVILGLLGGRRIAQMRIDGVSIGPHAPSLVLAAATIVGLFVAAPAVATTLGAETRMATYAAARDREQTIIDAAQRAGISRAVLPPLGNLLQLDVLSRTQSEMEIGPDPGFWVNQCAAQYYGIKEVVRP